MLSGGAVLRGRPTDVLWSSDGRRGSSTLLVSLWYHPVMALTLRTDDELERALDLLCEQEGLSRQELIRRAVLERAERAGHRERVDAAAERAVARWGEVLDRLGTV